MSATTGRLSQSQPEFQDPTWSRLYRADGRQSVSLVHMDFADIEQRVLSHLMKKGSIMDFNYQALALRTNSPNYNIDQVPAGTLARALHQARQLLGDRKAMDSIKRTIFYGTPLPEGLPTEPGNVTAANFDAVPRDVLHAVIGILTEAGELADLIFGALFEGETLDLEHVKEELGDIAWYRAVGLAAAGSTPEENDRSNIAKLMKRFPDKYDDDLVLKRDLAGEREALQGFTAVLMNPEIIEYGPGHVRVSGDIYQDAKQRFRDGERVTTNRVSTVTTEPVLMIETDSSSRYEIRDAGQEFADKLVAAIGSLPEGFVADAGS